MVFWQHFFLNFHPFHRLFPLSINYSVFFIFLSLILNLILWSHCSLTFYLPYPLACNLLIIHIEIDIVLFTGVD